MSPIHRKASSDNFYFIDQSNTCKLQSSNEEKTYVSISLTDNINYEWGKQLAQNFDLLLKSQPSSKASFWKLIAFFSNYSSYT